MVEEPAPPSEPDVAGTFADALARLDAQPGAGAEARALFARFQGPSSTDESQRADLDLLLAFIETAEFDHARALMTTGFPLDDVHEIRKEGAGSKGLSTDVLAAYDALTASGITLRYIGEGDYDPAIDYAGLARGLTPSLTTASRLYLEAAGWELDHVLGRYDEPGFVGSPYEAARSISYWEDLQSLGSPGFPEAKQRADEAATRYLRICVDYFARKKPCKIGPELREAYEHYIMWRPYSNYVPVVRAFLDGARKAKFRMSEDELDALVEQSLAAVATP